MAYDYYVNICKPLAKCIVSVQDSIEKATAPGSCCHLGTSFAAQEASIVQGLADGNVAVVGHDVTPVTLRSTNMFRDFSEKKVETAESIEATVEVQLDRILTLSAHGPHAQNL
ncbi:hypothetical protein LUU34_01590000 [Aix galericulata]|nr:hypothetical protein LUU34_01590000 [Aix galericulata]